MRFIWAHAPKAEKQINTSEVFRFSGTALFIASPRHEIRLKPHSWLRAFHYNRLRKLAED
jgi:hypothetical protein